MSLDLRTKTHIASGAVLSNGLGTCLATSNFERLVQASSNVQDDQQDRSHGAVRGCVVVSSGHREHRSDPGKRVTHFLLTTLTFEIPCSFHSSTPLSP